MSRFSDTRDLILSFEARRTVREARAFMDLSQAADELRRQAELAGERAFSYAGIVEPVTVPHRLLYASLSKAALLQAFGECQDGTRGWEEVGENFDFGGWGAFVPGKEDSLMFAGNEIGNDRRDNSRTPGELYLYSAPEFSFRVPLSKCTNLIPMTVGRWEALREI